MQTRSSSAGSISINLAHTIREDIFCDREPERHATNVARKVEIALFVDGERIEAPVNSQEDTAPSVLHNHLP